MQTSSSRKGAALAAEGAAYVCLALALSYIEVLIPFEAFLPIPGFKLGLANIVIIFAFYRTSPAAAGLVSLSRVILSSFLFGSVTSLLYSLSGAAFAFAALVIMELLFSGKIGFIGISAVCAVFHNAGQLCAACIAFSPKSVLPLFPWLIFAGALCGIITGIVLCALPEKLYRK